ncbi:uncharacterized protein HD556DRAFT_1306421 [Suillus plorans]|uniref:Uncharacterized protein n=1 Tax=Suillus plorans TaxID=116603 RepID=A0A9P7DLK2_9AGAM|nr:uncharacterized protein HD556DRAFT_1306421 [Suillus plorans]KAG1797832.1 hypothetical protein HD556DRAFT_1306421 [Suillus plorans]
MSTFGNTTSGPVVYTEIANPDCRYHWLGHVYENCRPVVDTASDLIVSINLVTPDLGRTRSGPSVNVNMNRDLWYHPLGPVTVGAECFIPDLPHHPLRPAGENGGPAIDLVIHLRQHFSGPVVDIDLIILYLHNITLGPTVNTDFITLDLGHHLLGPVLVTYGPGRQYRDNIGPPVSIGQHWIWAQLGWTVSLGRISTSGVHITQKKDVYIGLQNLAYRTTASAGDSSINDISAGPGQAGISTYLQYLDRPVSLV